MAQKIKRHFLRTFGLAVMLLMVTLTVPGMISGIPVAKASGALTFTNVQPSSLVAGASGNAGVSFTVTGSVPNNGKIVITFPSTFTLNSGGATATTGLNNSYGGTTYTVTDVTGQTVTLTGNGVLFGIGGGGTISNLGLSHIGNQQFSGTTGTYTIATTTAGDVGIDIDDAVPADTFTVGALTSTDVVPATSVVGATGAAAVTFTNTNPIPGNGIVSVTFPTNYTLSSGGASVITCSFAGGAGDTGTSGVIGNVVTFTRTEVAAVAASGAQSCSVTNVRNQFSGATGAYTIATFLTGGVTGIDSVTTTGSPTITAAAAAATVTLGLNSVVGTAGNTTLSLTLPEALATNDTVVFTLPLNLVVPSIPTGTISGGGAIACTGSGQIITCTDTGANTSGANTIVLTNVTARYAASGLNVTSVSVNYGGIALQVEAATASGSVVTTTTAADSTATNATVSLGANSVVGTAGNTLINFTLPIALVAGDTVEFTLPANLDITGLTTTGAVQSFGGAGTFDCTATAPIVCTAIGAGNTGGTGAITLLGIKSKYAASGQILTDFQVKYQAGATAVIAVDTSVALVQATTAADANASIAKASPTVGSSGALTLTFNVPRTLVPTDKINITFPGFYLVAATTTTIASTDVTCQTGNGNTLNVTYPGSNVLTLTVAGGKGMTSDSACRVTIPGLDAVPQYIASTDITTFTVQTSTSADIATDTSVALTDTVALGALSSTNVEPASLIVLNKGTVTVSFTTADAETLLGDDKIKVTFPAGYDVSGVGATDGACTPAGGGTFSTSVSGQVVTITRTSGATVTPQAITCTIANVWTPNTIGTTGVYYIDVVNTSNVEKYQDLTVAGDAIVGGSQNSNNGGGGGGGVAADTTPPTNTSVAIVGAPKVSTANVQLTLAATGATEMLISNVADFTGATWETYNTLKDWTLTVGPGAKTVYAKFRDAAHNVSAAVQANVTVEANAPAPTPVPIPTADATTGFTDTTGHWASGYINKLFTLGVVTGRTSTTFAPDDFLTRAEMVKIAVLTFKINVTADATSSFSDVSATDWFAKYVAAAEKAGIVSGYSDGTFKPNTFVNRAEALKILLIASAKYVEGALAGPFTDVPSAAWFAKYVNFAYAKMIVSGKTATIFAPADNVTRAEMAKMAVKALEL